MTGPKDRPRPDTAHDQIVAQAMAVDLAFLGVDELAYVAPDKDGGFAIHAADGELLGKADSRATAFAAAIQNDLVPLSVH